MERTVSVIGTAGAEEVCQHVIFIGCANQLGNRNAHLLCKISRQNIAKVAGRHADVDGIAHLDISAVEHVAVCRDIICNLRCQTAPVDGVCRGQRHALLIQLANRILIREDFLDCALCIVKIAANRAYLYVAAALGDHLQLLNRADTVHRIVNHNFGALYVRKAVQSSLAGVAGRCNQNARCALLSGLFQRSGQQMRQHLQRHILECAGRAMPQLQNIRAVLQLYQRSRVRAAKLFIRIGTSSKLLQLLCGEIGQKATQNIGTSAAVILFAQGSNVLCCQLRNFCRAVQTAVRSDAGGNRLCRADAQLLISCAYIIHELKTSWVFRYR